MHYVAAIVAFIIAYVLALIAVAELSPHAAAEFFRAHRTTLGFLLLLVSLAAAVIAFRAFA